MNVDVQTYAGAESWQEETDAGLVLLHGACVGDLNAIHDCMSSEGYYNVDQTDKQGRTALHWAVERGHVQVVEALVTTYHASLDILTKDSESPLMFAVLAQRIDLVRQLLTYGAYPQHTNKEGASALHLACAQGSLDIVHELIAHGAWLELEDAEGESPLFYAIRESHPECVRILLQAGARPDHPNNDKDTPLSLALECSQSSPQDPNYAEILSLLQTCSPPPPQRHNNLMEPFTRIEARSFGGSSSGNLCGFLTKTI